MRPAWSSGILDASPTPVSWHIRQLSRPSKVWGVAVGSPVGVGAGFGVGVVVVEGVGFVVGSVVGAEPPQAVSSSTMIRSAAINTHCTDFCFTLLTSSLLMAS